MKPSSAKAKGRQFQQAIRDLILSVFTQLEPDDVRSQPMGAPGEDIMLSPAARRLLKGIQVECKNCAAISVNAWLKQAAEHGVHIPVVFFKPGRAQNPLVVLDAEDFLKLLKG